MMNFLGNLHVQTQFQLIPEFMHFLVGVPADVIKSAASKCPDWFDHIWEDGSAA